MSGQNGFNQRSVGFRETGEAVVLDWELARVNTPSATSRSY